MISWNDATCNLVEQASIIVALRSVHYILDIVGTSAPVYTLRIWKEV